MSSRTMAFAASTWPAVRNRSTSNAPDLSVASLRVSETVSTATRSGLSSRGSLVVTAVPPETWS